MSKSKIRRSRQEGSITSTAAAIVIIFAIIVGAAIFIRNSAGTPSPSGSNSAEPASSEATAALSILGPYGTSVSVGQEQHVTWTSSGAAPATVSVNLIKKVGTDPNRYELVRAIATSTKNDGSAVWVPAKSDVGTGLSIEIGCGPSANACTAAENVSAPLAVVPSNSFANTAAAYQAIEQAANQ
ncbi:MAG: hypothetical protein KGI66_00625 [Patescibacteria group bacterium]|nr:hypothetical protein [Patescibacteria group bacterium]